MSPFATSVGFPPPAWYREYFTPMLPNPLAQDSTAQTTLVYAVQKGWPFDQSTRNTVAPLLFAGSISSAGGTQALRTVDGRYAWRISGTAAALGIGHHDRLSWWVPQLLEAVAPAGDDDEAQRVGWLRLYLRSGGSAFVGVQDRIGFNIVPDDGTVSAVVADIAQQAGGFGIFGVSGSNAYRYASYGPGGALLEATALTAYSGWHTVDFIIRQAVRGDASTPWLTVRHDGTDLFTERPFGHALLAAPTAILANASNFSFLIGSFLSAAAGAFEMSYAYEWRQGLFHPDGYPQP